jgi:hypothetical protein
MKTLTYSMCLRRKPGRDKDYSAIGYSAPDKHVGAAFFTPDTYLMERGPSPTSFSGLIFDTEYKIIVPRELC